MFKRTTLTILFAALALISGSTIWLLQAAAQGSSDAQRLDKLEVGVERAEALRAIKRLQYSFNHYIEAGLWNDMSDLLTADATAEFIAAKSVTEKMTGKASVQKYWMDKAGRKSEGLADGQLNTHILLQPIVNLGADGKTAQGAWHEIALLGIYGTSATWEGGIYENDYVQENGVWKIARIRFHEQYRGAYEEPGQKGTAWDVPWHFTGEHVGVTIPQSALTVAAPGKGAAAARLTNAAARLERMDDENAVSNLQGSYGYYMDRKLWDDASDLFTDDATWESGQRGVYAGRTTIRKALEALYGAPALRYGELFDHIMMGTVVDVAPDGETAMARTTELLQVGLNNQYARWELGTYENEFVKDGGVWKIKALHYYPRMLTNYDKGWGKEALPAPGMDANFAPTKKPAVAYEIYPKFSFPSFHYANPVTGKAVKYPGGVIKTATLTGGTPKASKAAETKKIDALETMLARAIGVDATENLMSSYGYYLDDGAWDDMANTFGLKGAKEITGAGVYVGAERIRAILKLRGPQGVGRNGTSYTIHQLTHPVIHVSADGKSANARMRLFQGGGRMDGASASWIGGTYENTAFFENGEWKFGRQDLHHHFNASYRNGWAKYAERGAQAAAQPARGGAAPAQPARGAAPSARGAAPAAAGAAPAATPGARAPSLSQQMPPDYPIRARQYTFPEIDEPAFHYKNPVSGRAPKALLP